MKTILTIPNHHPNLDFLQEWTEQLLKTPELEIIIMQDTNTKIEIPEAIKAITTIYNHSDVKGELGSHAWIIPKGTSACRSYAYLKAWQRKPDTIITLDNDCFPDSVSQQGYVKLHNAMLQSAVTLNWVGSNRQYEYTRGYPYHIRDKAPVILNHGLWSKVPDFDASTHLTNYKEFQPTSESMVIPRYNFFPMCGMNLAWKAFLTPAMYFGIFGEKYGFDQFDDIWAGILVKKIMDHLGFAARSGLPSVEHRKQSDPFVNMKKQAPGMAMNEVFWQTVQGIQLTQTGDIVDIYMELITKLPDIIKGEPEGWTKRFKQAALIWAELFK